MYKFPHCLNPDNFDPGDQAFFILFPQFQESKSARTLSQGRIKVSSSIEGEFFPYLPPGDPTRIDDCALLNFPHEVAQVGGEEQQMGNPRQINKGEPMCNEGKVIEKTNLLRTCLSLPLPPIVHSLCSLPLKVDAGDRKIPRREQL